MSIIHANVHLFCIGHKNNMKKIITLTKKIWA